jgi:hypothetical protein
VFVTIALVTVAIIGVFIASADLPANFSARKLRRVHVGIGSTFADGFQGGSEITWVNALGRRPRHIRRNDCPVMVPDVAAGQAGCAPPPHKKIITAPATLVGAKCKCETTRFDERPENVTEKVMTPSAFSM